MIVGISHEGGTRATNGALGGSRRRALTALFTITDRSPGGALADVVVATEEADQAGAIRSATCRRSWPPWPWRAI
jgi:hypothetical protein